MKIQSLVPSELGLEFEWKIPASDKLKSRRRSRGSQTGRVGAQNSYRQKAKRFASLQAMGISN